MTSNIACIIADDLTGANDTALQFHLKGANTQILLCDNVEPADVNSTQTWAVSTESRNVSADKAYEKVRNAVQMFKEKINPDYFYKKIDSTLRGNIAVEVIAMLEVLNWDAAIIVPAFPAESRITVGGYHLSKGVPIERTEMARDPHSPIFESYVPKLLSQQMAGKCDEIIGHIELKTVMQGAGPILMKIKELIEQGKKIIIVDAVSTVDIEQIALAVNKADYKLLPAGAAAFAGALSDLWFEDMENEHSAKTIAPMPKLIISGSATQTTSNQIDKLEQSGEFENILIINLDLKTVLDGVQDELADRIALNLGSSNIVVVSTSQLIHDFDGFSEDSLNAELTKANLASAITDFLAELAKRVVERKKVILIMLGGETSYKCCEAICAEQLQLVDEVAPAIALSQAPNGQWLVTKSGNLGGINTLVDILKYFEKHEE
jgi:uncharacterized protein YgbK (DUF1537 family)